MSGCPVCGHSLASKADVSAFELREETVQGTVVLTEPYLLQTLHPEDQPLIFPPTEMGGPPVMKGVAIIPLDHGEKMILRYTRWARFITWLKVRWARFITWTRVRTWRARWRS